MATSKYKWHNVYVKTITIHVPEDTYRAFQERAAQTRQSASSLIRDAMDEYYRNHMSAGGSIYDGEPVALGRTLADLSQDDDLLDEMLR